MKLLRQDNTIGYTEEELEEINAKADRVLKGLKHGSTEYWEAAKCFINQLSEHAHVQTTADIANNNYLSSRRF